MKSIIFKIWKYPLVSETFITSQIITAINCGFDVKIIVEEVLPFEESKQIKLLEKHRIFDKIIIENYNIPKARIYRVVKWLYLLIKNIRHLSKIISFYKYQHSFSLTWLYQLVFYKKHRNVSIFHIQYGTNKTPLDVLKKIDFIKSSLIVTFHGHDAFFPINGIIPKAGYYDALFGYGDFVIANTPYLANEITALGCPTQKLKIIPVGVDTTFFSFIAPKKKDDNITKLITVGRLEQVKGHKYVIEVAERLHLKGYQIEFVIVGEGREREVLTQLIEDKALQKVVQLAGRKGPAEVREMLQSSDIFLFTSVATNEGRRETQGLATLEAQACGLTVVVFDSGGVKFTVKDGETGFVVPEYDTEAMTSRIIELIENDKLRKKMSKQAVKFVNANYSQKVIDETWKYLYESLSNGK